MTKKVLVISPTPSHPHEAGNRIRIYNLLTNLQGFDLDVYFCHIQCDSGDNAAMKGAWGEKFFSLPYTQLSNRKRNLLERSIRKLRCILTHHPKYPWAIDDWYDPLVDHFLLSLQKQHHFDIVIVEYVFFSRALNLFGSDVLKVIDTHDVFTNRNEIYCQHGQKSLWFSTTSAQEAKGLRRANLVIAIQKKEEEFFRKLIGGKVITVGHTVPLRKRTLTNVRSKILYIASSNDINVHSLRYFLQEVLPKVQSVIQDVQLVLAGKICEVVDSLPGVIKLGYLENLDDAYDAADIVVNPTQFGTGLKIKSIEALGQSKILVSTPAGSEGLESGSNEAFLLANTSDEFAQHLVKVLTHPNYAKLISEAAYAFAENYNRETFRILKEALS